LPESIRNSRETRINDNIINEIKEYLKMKKVYIKKILCEQLMIDLDTVSIILLFY